MPAIDFYKKTRSITEQFFGTTVQFKLFKQPYWSVILDKSKSSQKTGALILSGIPSASHIEEMTNKGYAVKTVVQAVEKFELSLFNQIDDNNNDIMWGITNDPNQPHHGIKHLPVEDHTTTTDFELTLEFLNDIHQSRLNGDDVCIHCRAGKGRSYEFVMKYLVCFEGMSIVEARKTVLKERPQVSTGQPRMDAVADFKMWLAAKGTDWIKENTALKKQDIEKLTAANKTALNSEIGEDYFNCYANINSWDDNLNRVNYLTNLFDSEYHKIIFGIGTNTANPKELLAKNSQFITTLDHLITELLHIYNKEETLSTDRASKMQQSFYTLCNITITMLGLTGDASLLDPNNADLIKNARNNQTLLLLCKKLAAIIETQNFNQTIALAACKDLSSIIEKSTAKVDGYLEEKKNEGKEPNTLVLYWKDSLGTRKKALDEIEKDIIKNNNPNENHLAQI